MPGQQRLSTIGIADQEVSLNTNTTGEHSAIIDIQVPHGYRYEFPAGEPLELFVYTHESFGSSGDPVTLSNNLVNSPSLSDIPTTGSNSAVGGAYSLVVWDDTNDIQSAVDSVDYGANQFGYSQANDLEVFYLWGDSSQVEFRQYAPDEERFEKQLIKSMRAFHEANTFSRESQITFSDSFSMSSKEHLKITVKTDVDMTNWLYYNADMSNVSESPGGPGSMTTYSYADFAIPVRRIPVQ